ncbi:hypothetical protein [Bradyrhizobium sp. 1]|uniref:hypothetical protein n=1 Tax=Bradyrhizobium sp. 1 TaxID=241591 RepID=UPI001FF71B0C|nr:hypothetical protein [Bradyrhizobium sp. 1]
MPFITASKPGPLNWLEPKLFKNGYETQFFDVNLSLPEKIAHWRAKPATSLQLMASVLLLSLLATIAGEEHHSGAPQSGEL